MGSNVGTFNKIIRPFDEQILPRKLSARGITDRLIGKATGDKAFARSIAFPESLLEPPDPITPAPLPPIRTRDDPAVLAARERLRLSESKRRGRAVSNLTGGLGATGVSRPEAHAALLRGE